MKVELAPEPDGFANVTVESRTFSGEPKWTRFGYGMAKQNSGGAVKSRIAEAIEAVPIGSSIELGCEAKVSKSGLLWYQARDVVVLAPPAQEPNGKSPSRARSTASA